MGTKMVPAYANLKIQMKLQTLTDKVFVKRFVSDIFISWTGTKTELEQFIQKANETIKFTFEVDDTSLRFLDTWHRCVQGPIVQWH